MQAQTPEVSAEKATTPPAVEDRTIYECTGCGTVTRDRAAQMALYKRASALSCCPERNMVPVKLAEPAPAQDELQVVAWRYAFGGGLMRDDLMKPEWREHGEYQPLVLKVDAAAAIAAARPAQTEQQPVAVIGFYEREREPRLLSWNMLPNGEHRLYAAPIAQTELVEALRESERFIAGFEGCELQEGTDALLAKIRAALAAQGGAA